MSFEVNTTPGFEKSAKVLSKRYRSFKSDMQAFVVSLSENPFQGDEIASGVRKIRMAITSKGRGKSGGARVITYTIVTKPEMGRVFLIEVYDKSDYSAVNVDVIKKILEELDLSS